MLTPRLEPTLIYRTYTVSAGIRQNILITVKETIMLFLPVMKPVKLRTLKLAVAFGSVFVWFSLLLTDVCLFSQHECFPHRTKFKASIILSLERLSFQETLVTDFEEDVLDLPRGLNHHVWKNNCVTTLETLCNFPAFPRAPDKRKVLFRTEITTPEDSATDGHRLLGYVLPNSTSEYQFAVTSNGFAEVWLSLNKRWRGAKRIAYIKPFNVDYAVPKWRFNVSKTQISAGINLRARRRYYIEILYAFGAQNKSESFLQVAWKRQQESCFKIIDGESLSPYTNDSEKGKYKMFDDELPHTVSCAAKNEKGYGNKYMMPETLPYLEHTAVERMLDYCEYRPSYRLDPANLLGFRRYDGVVKHMHKTYSFPYPIVKGIVRDKKTKALFYAELPLDEEEAWSVVHRYMDALEKGYSG